MSRFEAFEATVYRGSGSVLTLFLAAFFVWSGVTSLTAEASSDPSSATLAFAAAGSMACLFVGTRTRSKLVQRLGLALFAGWLGLLLAGLFQ